MFFISFSVMNTVMMAISADRSAEDAKVKNK